MIPTRFLGLGIAAAAVGVAKQIPNHKVRATLTPIFYRAGVLATLGLARSPALGPIWNKTVEPYVVDLLDNVAFAVHEGFIRGLRSDNLGERDPEQAPEHRDRPDRPDRPEHPLGPLTDHPEQPPERGEPPGEPGGTARRRG